MRNTPLDKLPKDRYWKVIKIYQGPQGKGVSDKGTPCHAQKQVETGPIEGTAACLNQRIGNLVVLTLASLGRVSQAHF